MIKKSTFIAIALCLFGIASFASNSNQPSIEIASKEKKEKPKPIQVNRDCSLFSTIENKAGCNIVFKQEETYRVTVEALEEFIPKVKTTVVEGVLVVEMDEDPAINAKELKNIKVLVEAPALTEIKITGSGGFSSQAAINATDKYFTLSVLGSGDIKLKRVECQVMEVKITGSGNTEIDELKTGTSDIEVRGSGNVTYKNMKARKNITLAIHGSGNISVNGSVDEINASISGSGNISGKVNCDKVSAVIKGSGDIKFSGDVKAHTTNVTGSGRVTIK